MAHESFEDAEIAELLNRHFVSIKVDKEERPDIDSIYMSVCQAFTGRGGWPTSIFMTAEQRPFFAGTYFPKTARGGMVGLKELLLAIVEKWTEDRGFLLNQAERVMADLQEDAVVARPAEMKLAHVAADLYRRLYDRKNGGFGDAPKFPTPHNLMFLLSYFQREGKEDCLQMAEHTLLQMYRGGLFDHIGGGFCRYSTDPVFLAPHFEKMLYDNALLILAYCKAFSVTKKALYLEIAEKTAVYVLREMTAPEGGFYSAQDADSEGEEGKYYLFTPDEITTLLGKTDGAAFNRHFDISQLGNFEGKSIPNLLHSDPGDRSFGPLLPQLAAYRKRRCALHLDDKILTFWNGLMIAALCQLYQVSGKNEYLQAAKNADAFLRQHLCQGDTLFVSFRADKRGVPGFLDDYAGYAFAQLYLYKATLKQEYLSRAKQFCTKVLADFSDPAGGLYLYSQHSETLILRPKETYDGATPSGNALMAWNLVRLHQLTGEDKWQTAAEHQLEFLAAASARYPAGHAMFLLALLEHHLPPMKVTVVPAADWDIAQLPRLALDDSAVICLSGPTDDYPLLHARTTYYVCDARGCLPPVNDLRELI